MWLCTVQVGNDSAFQYSECLDFFTPSSLITNWIWLYEPKRRLGSAPMLIQFDGDTRLGGKLERMRGVGFFFCAVFHAITKCIRQMGFYFLNATNETKDVRLLCDSGAVSFAARRIASPADAYHTGSECSREGQPLNVRAGWSHWQFGLYQWAIDMLNKTSVTKQFLTHVVFPHAHYFMITL